MVLLDEAEKLRRCVSELETALSELQEQSRQVNARLAEREAADRRKDDFIAMLGHELRNPLAAIQAGLDLWASASQEHAAWIRQVLTRQTEQLARIVDDLLDFSRIDRGDVTLRVQLLELSQVVAGALASVDDLLVQRGHVLEVCVPDGLRLSADPARLEQILVNLLTNAARYTDEGGDICLRASQEDDHVRIEVQDSGIGLSPEMINSVFDLPPSASDPQRRRRGGLGIELRLVRELVEMHQGKISAASEGPGRGSTFTVILPIGSLDQEPLPVLGSARPLTARHPRRILVLDDNRDLAVSLAFLLSESGHTVETAYDGESAVNLARHFRPDVTLLNVGLPDLEGDLVAGQLRCLEAESGRRMTIIGISGFGQDWQRSRLGEKRFFDHLLVKPLNLPVLYSLIETSDRSGGPASDSHAPAPERHHGEAHQKPSGFQRMLIIDDTKMVADLTQQLLESQGYITAVAYDGPRGIALASEFKPDVVLCDLNLAGGISGWDVASAIREGGSGRVPVLVALTAWNRDEIRQGIKKSDFDLHLMKPLEIRELERQLGSLATVERKTVG